MELDDMHPTVIQRRRPRSRCAPILHRRAQRDVQSAAALGVNTIPTFFVNNEKVSGSHSAEELAAIIDRLLSGG